MVQLILGHYTRYVPRWLQFIGPCPETIKSYQYKWAYHNDRVRKRWLRDEIDFLEKYWDAFTIARSALG